MPDGVFGLPVPAHGFAIDSSLLVSTETVADVPMIIPDTTFTLVGRCLAGFVTIYLSENAPGQEKVNTYRLYRDGVQIYLSTFTSTADSDTGKQHSITLTVPAQAEGRHLYYATWALNLTTSLPEGLYSARRVISVLARPLSF